MRLPVIIVLLCVVASTAAAPAEPLTQSQIVALVSELVEGVGEYTRVSPDAPGAFPLWAVERAEVAKPLLIHRYPGLEPSYFIVPVVDDPGRPTSFVTIDSWTGAWQAYWGAPDAARFPEVGRERAAEIAGRVAGRECAPDGLRAVSMPNKRLYWHLEGREAGPEIFIGFAEPPDVHIGLDDELTRALEPAPEAGTHREAEGPARRSGRYPPSYDIAGVPFHYQQTSYNCGPAALEMVFDYCGPDVNQTDIARVANTNSAIGTYALDLKRAAHFSYLSTSVQWPYFQGYSERPVGYATNDNRWSYPNDDDPEYPDRYNDLKTLISSDFPIIILSWYDATHASGHFRVVKGYDDSTSVFIVHDPWDPNLGPGAYWGPDVHFNQAFLVDDLWRQWYRWAMFTAPWDIECTAPSSLFTGDEFTVTAAVVYPGPHPFEGDYPATNRAAEIVLPDGFSLPFGETAVKALPSISVTGTADAVSWQVVAACDPGPAVITVEAVGRVSGGAPSYPSGYTDEIGGEGEVEVVPASRVIYVDVNGSGDFLTISEGLDAVRCSGDSIIVLPGTYTGENNTNLYFEADLNIVLLGPAGPESTIIDCEGAGRGISFFDSDTTAVLSGFTIRNGDVSELPPPRLAGGERQWYEYTGGGILCFESSPRLRDLVIEGCTACCGGGISWVNAWPNIEDALISGNSVLWPEREEFGRGGGAYFASWEETAVPRVASAYDTIGRFRNVEFSGNTATHLGGGMYADAFGGNLWDVTFRGNMAVSGGGAYMQASAPRLEWTLFARNVADRGAAILFEGVWEGEAIPRVDQTTVAYNDAAPGWSAVEWSGGGGWIARTIISHTIDGAGVMCTNDALPGGGYLNVYGNAGGDSICVEEWKRSYNMSYDPLYCDAAANDFTLYDDSRCLPPNNPWGVLIGRYDAGGCGQSDVAEPLEPVRSFMLSCSAPNPAPGAAVIHYEVPTGTDDLTVAVYSLHGRLVRALFDGPVQAGPGRLTWDGRDEAGHPVASGVYFVRAAYGSEDRVSKLVVLR
jgi:predicted outer membrane repeat protein